MKVTLHIHGRERTFSEQELIAILEKHFSKVEQVPTEAQCFEVNPEAINKSLFKKKRKDEKQEKTRKLILEAFAEVKNNPEKYGKKFMTYMPKKTWKSKTVEELKQFAGKFGDHNADWTEQALEWAQRIANGETWEEVCNKPDTANWCRLVVWKNGSARIVGGSRALNDGLPASHVTYNNFGSGERFNATVPLMVVY